MDLISAGFWICRFLFDKGLPAVLQSRDGSVGRHRLWRALRKQTFMAILNRYKHFSLYVTCSNDFIPVVLKLFERQLWLSKHVQAQLLSIKMRLLIYKIPSDTPCFTDTFQSLMLNTICKVCIRFTRFGRICSATKPLPESLFPFMCKHFILKNVLLAIAKSKPCFQTPTHFSHTRTSTQTVETLSRDDSNSCAFGQHCVSDDKDDGEAEKCKLC